MKRFLLTMAMSLFVTNSAMAANDSVGGEFQAYVQEQMLDAQVTEIQQRFYRGEIDELEAELLIAEAYGVDAGFYVEINGKTYVISFSDAWKCAKNVAKTLGCLVSTRSISCFASKEAAQVVASCRLRRAK